MFNKRSPLGVSMKLRPWGPGSTAFVALIIDILQGRTNSSVNSRDDRPSGIGVFLSVRAGAKPVGSVSTHTSALTRIFVLVGWRYYRPRTLRELIGHSTAVSNWKGDVCDIFLLGFWAYHSA